MINIKNFDPNLLIIDKISFECTNDVIYNTRYITMKSIDNENIYTKTLFILFLIMQMDTRKKKNGNSYLIFASKDKDKENQIKNRTDTINGGEPIEYKKDFMKIRFEPDDDLLIAKILSTRDLIIIVDGSIFQEDNKYYPQVHLHECGYKFFSEL